MDVTPASADHLGEDPKKPVKLNLKSGLSKIMGKIKLAPRPSLSSGIHAAKTVEELNTIMAGIAKLTGVGNKTRRRLEHAADVRRKSFKTVDV